MGQTNIENIMSWLDEQLEPEAFKDYAPNGLQVQGKQQIKKIVCGVTASLDFLEKAIEKKADAVIVHHGWFWKNEDSRILGAKYKRIETLIKNDVNLIGYHLPLDAHPRLGNNACLGEVLDLEPFFVGEKPHTFGPDSLIWLGKPKKEGLTVAQLRETIRTQLDREPLVVGEDDKVLKRIAWCTGGAQGFFDDAIAEGVDAYITGEASEKVTHMARESDVAYFGAGHHATERYGVQALGKALKEEFPELDVEYIEIPNPV